MSESNKNIYVLDKEKKDTAGAIRKMAAIFAAGVSLQQINGLK